MSTVELCVIAVARCTIVLPRTLVTLFHSQTTLTTLIQANQNRGTFSEFLRYNTTLVLTCIYMDKVPGWCDSLRLSVCLFTAVGAQDKPKELQMYSVLIFRVSLYQT